MTTTTTTTATLTTVSVADVRRGDVLVDGAGVAFRVDRTRAPMSDMAAVYFTMGGGEFRYLVDDSVQVVAR